MIKIKKIKKITHTYKNFKRYCEIVHVIFKYGFGDSFIVNKLNKFIHIRKKTISDLHKKEIAKLSTPVKLRMALAELGPTFIKLGQILATRPDLIPADYTKQLYKLQDDAPHFSFKKVKNIFLEETGKLPKEIFDYFEEEPIAAASIGQVHKAVYNGIDVVVKVQRPNIQEKITTDLEILYHLAQTMEKHIYEIMLHKPSEIVKEFKKSIEKELDFRTELSQTERFCKEFNKDHTVYAPKTYQEISTSRILVLEFIDGIKLHNKKKLIEDGYDLKVIAERGCDSLLRQIFVNGYFHADPHPGNIFVLPDNVFCFIDFGMMGKIDLQEREAFAEFLLNIITKRSNRIAMSILGFCTYEKQPDVEILKRDMADLIDECLIHPLLNVGFGAFVEGLMEVLLDHFLRIKPNLFLLMKSLASIETVAYDLDPELEFVLMSEPYIKKIIEDRFSKKRIIHNFAESADDYLKLINEFPGTARVLLKRAKLGSMKLKLNVEQKKMREAINRLSFRIACSIILAALLLSHSLILLIPKSSVSHVVKTWGGIGFIVSVFLAFYLIISFFRKQQ